MNEFKIIEQHFAFLLEHGFSVCRSKSNIEYAVVYSSKQTRISLSYDLRTHIFDVDVSINAKTENYICIPLYDTLIGTQQERNEFYDSLKQLYSTIEGDWTITKAHFISLVDLHAQYVKKHLDEIIQFQEIP